MYIKQLETFLMVAKTGSFIRAAEQLYLSQPAVTQQIQNLENELNFPLLIRTKHKVTLTPAGKCFLSGAQQMIDIYQNTLRECIQITQNAPDCTIHYVGKANLHMLPDILREFRAIFPDWHIATQRVRPDQAVSSLINGTSRLLLTPVSLVSGHSKITFLPICQAKYYCVMSDRHPFAHYSQLSLEQLANCTFLTPLPEFCPPHMESLLSYIETKIPGFSQINVKGTDDAFVQLLCSYDIAIMPEYACPQHPKLVSIPLSVDRTETFGIAYKDAPNPAEQKLIKYLCSNFR